MSHRLGISWGLNQEQQQVGQGPKTSSTADEEICNNKEQKKDLYVNQAKLID